MFINYVKNFLIITIMSQSLSLTYAQHTINSDRTIDAFDPLTDTETVLYIIHECYAELINIKSITPLIGQNGAFFMLKKQMIEDKPITIKVLRENNSILGFIAYYMKTNDEGYILALAIRKEFRHKKYAQTLLTDALNDCAARGATNITLMVIKDNIPAYNFYKQFNFFNTNIMNNDDNCTYFKYYYPQS